MHRHLILSLFLSLPGCVPGIVDCAAPLMPTLTEVVVGEVRTRIGGQGFSPRVLDELLGKLGPAVICAVAKIAASGDAAALSSPDQQLAARRARAWLKDRRFAVRGAP